MASIYIDFHRFRRIDDRFGHGAGDRLLKSVAEPKRCLARMHAEREFSDIVANGMLTPRRLSELEEVTITRLGNPIVADLPMMA